MLICGGRYLLLLLFKMEKQIKEITKKDVDERKDFQVAQQLAIKMVLLGK